LLKEITHQQVIEGSLAVLNDQVLTKKALQDYNEHKSLSRVFQNLEIIQLPDDLINLLTEKEAQSNNYSAAYASIFQAEEIIQQSLQLFKVRLTTSLSYAVVLSFFALLVSAIIGFKVLPQFESIFSGFGSHLPAATKFLISWQNSVFSPTIIGSLLFLCLLYLYIHIIRLGKKRQLSALDSRLPFIKRMSQFVQNIRWLSYLNLLSSVGYSVNEIRQTLEQPSENLARLMPNLNRHLEAAETVGTLESEINFQMHQFSQSAEQQVTKAARQLVAFVMGIIVSYIILIIFASYLPIFQLGEAL